MDIESILNKLNTDERAEIERLIWIDALTGLRNRRAFDYDTRKETRKSEAIGYGLTMLMIDVDKFKTYNDTKGHPEGDILLTKIGETIRENIKGFDTCYRYGGEEMCVLLPNTNTDQAYQVAERLRVNIQERTGQTISIGVSAYENDISKFISEADKALYVSKETGRNKTTIARR